MAARDFLGTAAQEDGADDALVVEVWACNLDAVAVFQHCPISGIGHMGGIHWQGIAPSEIRHVCLLLRQPHSDWPDLLCDVAYMGRCVAEARNTRDAARRK